jgi:tetratricopeptide (TPR) repeat protein
VAEAGVAAERLHEALSALQSSDLPRAAAAAMSALDAFGAVADRTGAAAAHQVLAIAALAQGDDTGALAHVDAAIPLRESTGDIEGVAALYQERMEICLRRGDVDGAVDSAERQAGVASRGTDREARAHAAHQLAQLVLQRGDDARAEALVQDALSELTGPADGRARAALLLLLSSVALHRGDAPRSLVHARAALAEARAARSRPAEIDALQQCGVVHAQLGEHSAAARALNEALVGRELLKDTEGKVTTLRELGNVELASGHVDEAIAHFEAAAAAAATGGNVVGEITMLQLAQATAEANDRAEVADRCARALVPAAERTGDREALAGAHFALATRMAARADLAEAAAHFRTAHEIQEVLGLVHESSVSRGMHGQVLLAMGERDAGIAHLRAALARLDALGSEAAAVVREVLAEAEVP